MPQLDAYHIPRVGLHIGIFAHPPTSGRFVVVVDLDDGGQTIHGPFYSPQAARRRFEELRRDWATWNADEVIGGSTPHSTPWK